MKTWNRTSMLRWIVFALVLSVAQGQEQEQPIYVYSSFYTKQDLVDAVDIWLAQDTESYDYVTVLEKYGPIEQWKTERIFDFAALFNADRNPLTANLTVDLSRWDVSNAETFQDMFLKSSIDFDVSTWKVGKVVRFSGAFHGATEFRGHGLSQWDTSRGRYFDGMFAETMSLNTSASAMDLRNWNLRSAESLTEMFRDSNFGMSSDSASSVNDSTNNLCSWNDRLYPTVDTTDMFLGSLCPVQTDPDLKNRTNNVQINFCVQCDKTPSQSQSSIRQPNLLFLLTDQQRFDAIRFVQDSLPQYNNFLKINTPNLDRLLQAGAYFENAYTECAVCAPARTSLRTGCTIERTGIQHNDLIYDYVNGELFTQRVEALEGLDHVLVEQYGYISEYYGRKVGLRIRILWQVANHDSLP